MQSPHTVVYNVHLTQEDDILYKIHTDMMSDLLVIFVS